MGETKSQKDLEISKITFSGINLLFTVLLISFIIDISQNGDNLYNNIILGLSMDIIAFFIITFLLTVSSEKRCGTETIVFLALNFLSLIIACVVCDSYSVYYEAENSQVNVDKSIFLEINNNIFIMAVVQCILCFASFILLGVDVYNLANYKRNGKMDIDDAIPV